MMTRVVRIKRLPLRTFARESSNIDFFCKTFDAARLLVTFVRNAKKLGGHRLRFGDKISERPP